MIEVKEHDNWEVECIGEFEDEYVYDIEMDENTNHTFFANDVLIHNSVYLTFDTLMNKLKVSQDDATRLKVTRFLAKIAMNELERYNETFFMDHFNADNSIFWDQELIARTGIWSKPKKYVCHILEENGKPPKHDMLKKGLDIVRSSIPRKFKKHLTTAVDMAIKEKTQEEIASYITDLYKEFKSWDYKEISIPSSCNNLVKWGSCEKLNFLSGSPQHMKAAIAYNHYIDMLELKDYEHIKEKDKFNMIFLGKNPSYKIESIGYVNKLPEEFDIEGFIDWDAHFQRGFAKPLSQIYEAMGWTFPETKNATANVDDLFE